MLFQFSGRVKKTTLVITGLSISLQCLLKSEKIILEAIEIHLKDNAAICLGQKLFTRGKSWLTTFPFITKTPISLTKRSKLMWFFLDFTKVFNTLSTTIQYPSGQNIQCTARQVHNRMGEQLVDRLESICYNKWGYIRLAVSHKWGFNTAPF